ncbi:MAG: ORF6N domain-containing protein, partial [Heliobacteriaceae bacterium]|nr:ORF6N domain-containing protein [Heliobacteriaceae bacterium]
TKNLNKAVKRNIDKFPPEFMFQLTEDESDSLRFQFGTSKKGKGGRRYLPYVFTEHGVLMTANILNSERANIISVEIIKVFIRLRNYALSNVTINEQIAELRQLLMLHIESNDNKFTEHDEAISQIVHALNSLIEQPKEPQKIGF